MKCDIYAYHGIAGWRWEIVRADGAGRSILHSPAHERWPTRKAALEAARAVAREAGWTQETEGGHG